MLLLTNKIMSSILEIVLFGTVPFIWWFVTARKKEEFTEWIGLKKTGSLVRKEMLH